MRDTEVLIIGGGPAGSSCAWQLRQHGIDCLVLDRAAFPRLKLCAGWITPEVVDDLGMDIATYPHSFLTFATTIVHLYGLTFRLKTPQHSIRRVEFDNWLLQRSGAPVVTHNARDIQKDDDGYIVDGQFRAKYLVGAGGTRCPVFRTFFREANPRAKELQVVALELEFPYAWRDGDCHLWFFQRALPGYAWYVPKADGHLNIGIGGMAKQLVGKGTDIKSHWVPFVETLRKRGLIDARDLDPGGYSYYLRAHVDTQRLASAFIIGDAAGLATRDMCEGIGPAIRSGLRAADAIASGEAYVLDSVARMSLHQPLIARFLERRFCSA